MLLLVIDNDWKAELRFLGLTANGGQVTFSFRFGSVNANHGKCILGEVFFPAPVPGVVPHAVDSAKSIKVQCDDLTS